LFENKEESRFNFLQIKGKLNSCSNKQDFTPVGWPPWNAPRMPEDPLIWEDCQQFQFFFSLEIWVVYFHFDEGNHTNREYGVFRPSKDVDNRNPILKEFAELYFPFSKEPYFFNFSSKLFSVWRTQREVEFKRL
jgi:hypothetical protein